MGLRPVRTAHASQSDSLRGSKLVPAKGRAAFALFPKADEKRMNKTKYQKGEQNSAMQNEFPKLIRLFEQYLDFQRWDLELANTPQSLPRKGQNTSG